MLTTAATATKMIAPPARLLILATDNQELHKDIKTETSKRNLLTNVADTPDLCDFYLGSIVQKGDLKIGISTNGKSPTFAKRFREFLEELLPNDLQELLDNLHTYRSKLIGDFEEKVKNKGFNGAVLVSYKGTPIFERYYGYKNYYTQEKITPSSTFQIASTSKTFTSGAILLLLQQNMLSLEDTLQKFFPTFP